MPTTAIVEYSHTVAALAELRGRLENVAYDLGTTKGLDIAIKAKTLAILVELHAAAVAHEAEQARLAAERERIAAEQKAVADRLADERKKFEQEQAAARAAAQKGEEEI